MSRDTFYRYKAAVEEGGVEALFERTRRKPNLANRVGEATGQARRAAHETLVKVAAGEDPAGGSARTRAMPTLREAYEDYLTAGPERKAATVAAYNNTVHRHLDAWLDWPLDTILRKDVEQCFHRLTREAG